MGTLRRTHRTGRRAGVTLTELLVVISIIATLAGLTFTVLAAAEQATARIEAQVASVTPKEGKKRQPRRPPPAQWVPNQYLVTFKRTVKNPQTEADRLATSVPANILHVYTTALCGCSLRLQ